MMRFQLLTILFVLVGGVVIADDNSDEAAAVKKIELLGGRVWRNGTLPGSPVVGVDFEGSKRFNDKYVHLLKAFPSLSSLNLNGCEQITDASLDEIRTHKELSFLVLRGTHITATGIAAIIKSLPQLHIADDPVVIKRVEQMGGKVTRDDKLPGSPVIGVDLRDIDKLGDEKEKPTKVGIKKYIYYRCARYQRQGHPRIRMREQEIDAQAQQLLAEFKVVRPDMQRLIINIALCRLEYEQSNSEIRADEVKRQISLIEGQKEELLNLRLANIINDEKFAAKQAELVERETLLNRQIQLSEDMRHRNNAVAQLAPKVFEIVQRDWASIDRSSKNDILKLLFGEFVLNATTLVARSGTPLELFLA